MFKIKKNRRPGIYYRVALLSTRYQTDKIIITDILKLIGQFQ